MSVESTTRAVQRCAASLVGPGGDRSGQNGSGGREIGFPDRRNSDSWGGNRGGGCRDRVCAAAGFAPLLGLLEAVPDPRRAEGKVYRLPQVLLFSILAIVSGGNSYRSVATFIDVHRQRLNRTFGLTLALT